MGATIERLHEQMADEADAVHLPYAFVVRELADIFNIAEGTLRDAIPWASRRKRARRFLREDIDAYLSALNPEHDVAGWYAETWLDTESAAAYLSGHGHAMTAATLRKHRERGNGPEFVRITGRVVRYSTAALDAFMWSKTAKGSELLML